VLVETATGERVICHPRGKKSNVVVGDKIQWLASQDEGTIEKLNRAKTCFTGKTKCAPNHLPQI
jgi:ribosome biogenesis GTPase